MQNVALAYKQTQAGTTGQDEVLLMLFDGALRFLAQARDKMAVKDFAAKGILISRALDIINELDSSLNMELGGELSKNLHQLYFLCTTRLLQANLKLDVPKLDSVVEILNGLRSAFAEVVARPEAKAACAQISARNAGKHTTVTASRPLSSSGGQMPPGMGGGEGQMPVTSARTAAGLYGQQTPGGQAPIPPQPMAQAALLATQMVTQNAFGVTAAKPPVVPATVHGTRVMAHTYGQQAKPVMAEAARSTPPTNAPATAPANAPATAPVTTPLTTALPGTPAPVAPQVGGFAGKRLAMYGKTQNS